MGPLSGMKVVELAHIMSGPVCGMMLADMGADVVKVEKAPDGDDSRRFSPILPSGESASYMSTAPGGSMGFLLISAVAFVLLGSFLEGIPAIVLFGPLLFPVARQLGINDVHYAMVAIFAMGLGLFAPPFGVGFYAACAIAKVDPDGAMKRVWPYLGALAVALLVLVAVPWVSTGFLSQN